MSIYHKDMEVMHSSDAYYKSAILKNNNLIIPYINIGVLDHPLNPSEKKMKYVNFAYLVYKSMTYLSVFINQNRYKIIGGKKNGLVCYAGGEYLDVNEYVFNDMEICCEEAFLQTLDFTEISDSMWLPTDTPNFAKNMDNLMVKSFFEHKHIPDNLKKLIE